MKTDQVKEGNEVINYLGFTFNVSNSSGGKAGRGLNKTSSYHVSNLSLFVGRYFSFKVNDRDSMKEAIRKAKIWIENVLVSKGICPYCADPNCTSDHK